MLVWFYMTHIIFLCHSTRNKTRVFFLLLETNNEKEIIHFYLFMKENLLFWTVCHSREKPNVKTLIKYSQTSKWLCVVVAPHRPFQLSGFLAQQRGESAGPQWDTKRQQGNGCPLDTDQLQWRKLSRFTVLVISSDVGGKALIRMMGCLLCVKFWVP